MATHFVYHPIAEATVNGVRRSLLAGTRTQVGFGQGTASATLVFNPNEGDIFGGDHVVVKFGYTETGLETEFTGQVQDDTIVSGPKGLSCTAVGALARTSRTIGEPDLPGTVDPDGQPIPAISWDASQTDAQIIADVLARYSITGAQLAGANVIDTSAGPVYLTKDQSGLSLIQGLDQAFWYRTFDGPDGIVRRVSINGVPSGSPAWTFQQGRDIGKGAQRKRDTAAIVNRVNAAGPANAAFTPMATVQADSAVDPATGEPLIPDPPKYVAQNFTSDYLRTEAQCMAYGEQTIGAQNRYLESLTLPLAKGTPGVRPGMSCAVVSSDLELDASVLWWVQDVEHQLGQQGLQTTLTLLGAYAGDGVNPNQPPTANIVSICEVEYPDGSPLYVVFADGSASFDPEDAYDVPAVPADPGDPTATPPRPAKPATPEVHFNGIALYQWGGSLGTPTVSDGGKHAVYVSTTDPTGKTITLTVYDSEGATGTTTVTVDTSATPPKTRDLWSAEGTQLAFSSDGGKTWADVTPAIAAVGCARAAAATYQLAYTAGGQLWRVTTLLVPTNPTGPANVTACSIRWKYPESEPAGLRAWLGCANGDIWRSDDSGNTFAKLATVPNGKPVVWVEESPFADNDAVALAGDTLYHSYDGTSWSVMYQDPDGLAAAAYAAGFGDAFVVFNGPLVSGEVSRVHERTDNVAGNWNGDAGAGPVDEPGAQPTALTIGVYTPTLIAGGDAPDGTAQVWTADASAPFTFKRATYDQLIFGHIRDLIRDGQFDGLVYGQGETGLFKTVDNFVSTIYRMRDYPTLGGGRAGYMVGYGKLRDAAPPSGLVLMSVHPINDTSAANSQILLLDSTGWHVKSNHPAPDVGGTWGGASGAPWTRPILKFGAYHFTLLTCAGGTNLDFETAQNGWRSADGGATWTQLPAPFQGVKGLDIAADGVGYAVAGRGKYLIKTTDWGATWTTILTNSFSDYTNQFTFQAVAVSPTNSAHVVYKMPPGAPWGALWVSTDGGATWSGPFGNGDGGALNNSTVLVALADGDGIVYEPIYDGHSFFGTHFSSPGSLATLAAGLTVNPYWPAVWRQSDGSLLQMGQINASNAGLYRSTDGAATWTRLYGQSGATFPSYNTDPGVTAGYIDGDGTIYTCNTRWNVGVAPTEPDTTIVKLPAGSSTWEDLTPSLVTAFGVKYQSYTGGMASA